MYSTQANSSAKRRAVVISVAAALSAIAGAAPAAAADGPNRFAIGVYGGTLGLGGDVQVRAADWLAFRAGGHWFDLNFDEEYDGIDYDADVGLSNAFLTADIHPFSNGWFLSGGVVLGDKGIDLLATPTTAVEIGDQVFTPEEVGVLTGEVTANDAAPFVGLGFDNAVTRDGRVGVSILLGVAFTGAPDVTLEASDGLLANDPNFQAQLAIEEENLRDEVDDYEVFPVARIGLTLGF